MKNQRVLTQLKALMTIKVQIMNKSPLSRLSDDELLKRVKKSRMRSLWNAVLVGFFIGIVIWSAVKNTWGFLTLIPLYFIYKLTNHTGEEKALHEIVKERNLHQQ